VRRRRRGETKAREEKNVGMQERSGTKEDLKGGKGSQLKKGSA